jgi:alkylation response protein AidB-like acyl-CoA dehydrogenase
MSATEFSVDLRDIRFVINEQLRLADALGGVEEYEMFDTDMIDTMLAEAERLSTELFAPLNKIGDEQGCTFDGKGNVTTPEGFKLAWQGLVDAGWMAAGAPEMAGGMPMPHAMTVAAHEMFTGANTSFSTYPGLARGAGRVLDGFAPQWLKEISVERMFNGEWGGTMCLTESGAGTSVGDNRTKAVPTDEDGTYRLEGEKIFITAGDQDLTENIIHLVLARAPGAPEGIKGLSIFAVPKFMFDAQGALGERNGIFVCGIEEKMGLHGSVTTTLALGGATPCTGWLLGNEGDGIKIMFHLMNEARIGVGVQGLSGASAAYNLALAYCKERIQGVDIDQIRDAEAPRIAIVNHPDVRRMLMWCRVHVETMRSFLCGTAMRIDKAERVLEGDDAELQLAIAGLLTPICKAHCTDLAFDITAIALQCYGGYGYTKEYPVEQYVRDTKIASIYEGTNGVQAMDLLGRKMRSKGGMVFMAWMAETSAVLDQAKLTGKLDEVVGAMESARDALAGCAMHLGGLGMAGNTKGAMLQATPFLNMFGHVVLGREAVEQARIAVEKLESDLSDSERTYYKGKILNARFYASNVLPMVAAIGAGITSGDESCMDEALFGA